MTTASYSVSSSTAPDSCMVSSLETWPLYDLLLWLHESHRTAMVRVGFSLDAGVIFFRNGHLIRCEYKMLRGEEALWCLLGVNDGDFSLIQRAIPEVSANIWRPTAEILLQYFHSNGHKRQIETA
ncbi:MAG: DUF4388 domain-containing protein [Deltaproteobacteria bacterium]|nr:DUF4388 domain-containing protein [Deltaproteobacteria bacterium]